MKTDEVDDLAQALEEEAGLGPEEARAAVASIEAAAVLAADPETRRDLLRHRAAESGITDPSALAEIERRLIAGAMRTLNR